MRIPRLPIEKLSLGYRFDKEREIVSLIYIVYFIILLFGVMAVVLHLDGEENILVTYRYHTFILIGFLELWLIKIGQITLARIIILTTIPFLILLLPPLASLFDDEFYFWFPYIPIAISIIPHFILHTYRNRLALFITLGFYLILTIFIDDYLIYLSDGSEQIIPFVLAHQFYYNLIPVIIFIFVNLAIGIVFAKNYEYEQLVLKQQDELIQSEKMASLGTLTTGIAHEINNPLNFISGSLHALNTLKDDYLKLDTNRTPEKKDLLEQIDRIIKNSFEGVKRTSDIIASLKFFANPGLENLVDMDLEKLFYEVLLSIERKIPYNITIHKKINHGTRVRCYYEQLQQVFINIISNAVEVIEETHSNDPRRIEISASETKRKGTPVTRITISNNGPAIPSKDLKKIFDPFFTRKENGKGKGLGMAISYMIVKEHKGWIEVGNRSKLVVFDIFLPRN
jgi:signal transduction histidine kinase